MKRLITVGLVQQQGFADKALSLEASYQGIKEAVARGAQLVLLQELHASYYFCQSENRDYFELSEPIPGPTTEFLAKTAKELQIVLVGSVYERRAPGVYHNTAVVFERDGSIAGKYRKMHIPDDPGYYEKYYFTPGDLGFQPIQTSVAKLGVLVCWDQWYPEAARIMALNGAELLLYPTAIGWFPGDAPLHRDDLVDSWVTIQKSHAIANCLPVMSCNRVGFEADQSGVTEGLVFWGNSFITGAHGKILAEASRDKPEVLVTGLDLSDSEKQRQIWPYFRDRRIDAYDQLLKRYGN